MCETLTIFLVWIMLSTLAGLDLFGKDLAGNTSLGEYLEKENSIFWVFDAACGDTHRSDSICKPDFRRQFSGSRSIFRDRKLQLRFYDFEHKQLGHEYS